MKFDIVLLNISINFSWIRLQYLWLWKDKAILRQFIFILLVKTFPLNRISVAFFKQILCDLILTLQVTENNFVHN